MERKQEEKVTEEENEFLKKNHFELIEHVI